MSSQDRRGTEGLSTRLAAAGAGRLTARRRTRCAVSYSRIKVLSPRGCSVAFGRVPGRAMSDQAVRKERRRDLRVSPKGTVIMHAEACTMRGRIVNLSRGGVAAITTSAAPERLLGGSASLDLRLDGRDSSWHDLRGRIVRLDGTAIAIALDAVPVGFASAI
ncbi:MAG TPA: PilZ domain-containing protein, partial [Kofleriaceae bacterium]|nr:PilZ domain-containing protein [Kofleriaceae bacterium]